MSSLFRAQRPTCCALSLIDVLIATLLVISLGSSSARAQGFGGRPGMGGPGPNMQKKPETKEGPAEAAPESEDAVEAELPPLPSWPGEERKKVQLLELHGYLRFRADIQHNHNLGLVTDGITRAPFWRPLAENDASDQRCALRAGRPVVGTNNDRGLDADGCPGKTLSGANMRLRVEPTINIGEEVRIHTQIDIFDNLVLGSTPDSLSSGGVISETPVAFLSESQAPPVVGENSNTPAIVVKRAWGEVDTALGQLAFGRMPWHWGLGMVANDGNCWDCNFGDNQDRVMFTTKPIAGHIFGAAYDFSASGPHSMNVLEEDAVGVDYDGRRYQFDGQAIDLEQLDDVDQLMFFAGRMDRPDQIEDKLARGEVVLNYGAFIIWRKQDFDYVSGRDVTDANDAGNSTLNQSETELAQRLIERHAYYWMPDLWLKLAWRNLEIEFEGVMTLGRIEDFSDSPFGSDKEILPRDILQAGFVLRSRYSLLNKMLKVGLEIGSASGDEAELYDLNRRRNSLRPSASASGGSNAITDTDLDEFRFDNDYLVDLILFREIMGTVANATYFKPWVSFEWLETLGARLDMIYSIANQIVAYPGNSRNLGIELDLDLYYKNTDQGFYAGLQYGVLFPLGALDRPEEIFFSGAANAGIAQTVQARLILKF
jgi:uncharacterized protein (TIGR04551 family)